MAGPREAWMRCADGIRLASRIWIPPGAGPWPVLLMRQPYGSALASTITYAHPQWYAAQGFVVVVQDVRGRGDSEGTFRGFSQEASDGAEAVRWARGLPESNGRLGTYGFSYQGLSQLLNDGGAASTAPTKGSLDPLPDCLAPAMCGLDERLDWASEGGAHWWALGLGWALQLAAQGAQRRGDLEGWNLLRQSLERGDYLREGLALLEQHDPEGMGLAWLRADPLRAEGWRLHRPAPALLRRPMLLIGGWHDPHLRGVLELWRLARAAGGRPTLQVGAWSHLQWLGGIDGEQVDFFRRHLGGTGATASASEHWATDGEAPRATAPGSIWLQDALTARWEAFQESPSTASGPWWLASDGRASVRSDEGTLLREPGARHGSVVLVHDPWRPVPGRGGHLGGEAVLAPRGDLDRRTDVACFTTPPLASPLRLCGRPVLRLLAMADQLGFDLCAALSVVSADGSAVRQLCTGVRRVLGKGATELLERCVELQPLVATLEAGERLRLSLAPAAWPQVAVNGGDGLQPHGGPTAGHRPITLTLWLEGAELGIAPLLPHGPDGKGERVAAN